MSCKKVPKPVQIALQYILKRMVDEGELKDINVQIVTINFHHLEEKINYIK